MLSKMAQPNNVGGGGGGGSGASGSGRRLPLSLSGGSTMSRLQQSSTGSNGRSNSPQNGNNKKNTESFVSLKKSTQQRTSSISSSSSSNAREEDKKSQNGAPKSTNGKEKPPQNGTSSTGGSSKDQKEQKLKDKVTENKEKEVVPDKEKEVVVENKGKEVSDKKESQSEAATEAAAPAAQPAQDIVVLDDNEDVAPEPTTPSKERKSTRKAGSQQKSPASKITPSWSPAQKKQAEILSSVPQPQEDVEMEPLTVNASPIRSVSGNLNAAPAATSTPGRSLFGFRSSSKQSTEVELATQPSSSPAGTPARSYAHITGRRSIRPTNTLTPSKVGSYRCVNSDLDTSSCTNASMNATVGSEIPNSSSFSFSFFGRGRKRERTPPPVSGSQSTNDLALDAEMSPPKRARFEMFSFRNLASPFSLLSSKFSKATIATPTRLRLEQTPPGDDDGEVHNVSHNVVEEENQLNTSSVSVPEAQDVDQASKDVTVGQEAGLETPKKGGSPAKEIPADTDAAVEGTDVTEQSADDENIPPLVEVAEAEPRSRCSIM